MRDGANLRFRLTSQVHGGHCRIGLHRTNVDQARSFRHRGQRVIHYQSGIDADSLMF